MKMKQIKLTILLAVLMSMVGTKALAHDFAVANADGKTIYYEKTSDTEVSVTCQGSYYSDCSNEYTGDIVIPATITYNDVTYGVSAIGHEAFSGCSGLTSITIPDGVFDIGYSAFQDCSSLTSVTIPNSMTTIGYSAFYGCSSLTSITIPNSVTNIGYSAFNGCSGLTSINIPNSVTSIGDLAFRDCSSLTSITIPNSVTSIGYSAFQDCSSLTSVTIPNSVTTIGEHAFEGCRLTSINIPNSVTSIGTNAFSYNYELTSIVVEAGNTVYDSRNNCNAIIEKNSNKLIQGCVNTIIPNNVTSIGYSAFNGCSSLTSITIPNSVTSIGDYAFSDCSLTSVTIPNSVITIGYSAFSRCRSLTSVNIPNSVTSIGDSAFNGCTSLTSITIPNSVTNIGNDAFSYCGLTSVTIPNSVTSIGDFAFSGCSGLTSVTIPNSVINIGERAFTGCRSLTSVNIPNSVTSIGRSAFDNTAWYNNQPDGLIYAGKVAYKYKGTMPANTNIILDEGTLGIAGSAFSSCQRLTSITIPNSVTTIGNSAFADCNNLTSVTIGSGVTSIGWGAFEYCSSLTSVTISNGVTSIGDSAFNGCSSLTSITIPNSVTSIGSSAFEGCSSLTSVTIPNSVTSIGDFAFSGCSGLTSVTIPNSVINIGERAFTGCRSLTSVNIPNSVTNIGRSAFDNTAWYNNQPDGLIYAGKVAYKYKGTMPANTNIILDEGTLGIAGSAFSSCQRLTSITIPNSVINIGENAFSYCSGLTSVTIPNSVTSIGNYAFNGCSSLTSVTVENTVPISIGSGTFSNRANATLYVPYGSKAAYEAADYWKEFKEIVESNNITFADANVKTICVANWDTNGDGELSEEEAAAVTDLGTVFKKNTAITSFNELIYFTSLTSIDNYSFLKCKYLASVTIPNSVTTIGEYAFQECIRLTSVTIGNSVTTIGGYAFYNCTGLTSITIPNSVTTIGGYAFVGCIGLASITIPNSVTSIGEAAFYNCSGLTSVTIPNSVTSIRNYAFSSCNSLTSVTVEWSEPISISSNVFSNRANATLYVPVGSKSAYEAADYWKEFGNIVAIGDVFTTKTIEDVDMSFMITSADPMEVQVGNGTNAAISKTYAGKITIPSSVTIPGSDLSFTVSQIGANAFNGCNLITSVGIPVSISSIGKSVFYGCSGLQEVVIPNSITQIPSSMDSGAIENIHVPGSVTWIGRYAINQCDNVVIEDGNSDLQLQDRNGDDGYYDGTLYGVKELYVGRNTDNNSFSSAGQTFLLSGTSYSELNNITFGPLVTKAFWGYDFRGCSSVTSVTCLTKEPFTSPDFYTIPQKAVLYVPLGSQQQYASANGWSQFGNITEVTEVTITLDDTEMVYAGDFDLDFSNVDGLKAYIAGDFDEAASTITLNPIQLVSAGKGVILKGAKGTYTVPCANIEATTADALCGTISGRFIRNVEDECVNYAFDKDEHVFKPVDAAYGCLISRNGAYLSLPASLISGNENITPIVLETEPSSVDVTDISQLDNSIYLDEVEAIIGSQKTISIKMKNSAAIRGFQFNMTLPEGVTPATYSNGTIMCSVSAARRLEGDQHTISVTQQADGSYQFLCGSLANETFTGTDGEVLTLKINIANNVPVGDYPITLSSIKLTETNINNYYETAEVVSKLTISDYELGDINGDGVVDVSDYIGVANHILGDTPTGFNALAADVNGDHVIDISDYIGIANIILAGSIYGNNNASSRPLVESEEPTHEPQ